MPAPEDPPEALHAHLEACNPCRIEQEGLRAVDRRVQRLGAYVLLAMPTLLVQLDRQVSQSLGGGIERGRRSLSEERGLPELLPLLPTGLGGTRRLLGLSVLLLALLLLGVLLRR